jgi:CheY-like chemotaxis protein
MAKTVLIVEDYDDTREFMKILLESYGYIVIEAADGIEAIDRVKQYHPDLILMDISLPVVDGLTVTRAIRDFAADSHVPIIAVTAFGKTYYNKAIEAGCNDLIQKPIDFDSLEPILRTHLTQGIESDSIPAKFEKLIGEP